VPDVEDRDAAGPGGVEDLADPADERLPVLDVRQDAGLHVVDQHGGRGGAAHLGNGVGNVQTEGALHAYSLAQRCDGGLHRRAGKPLSSNLNA
jgi:hypothetical protein